MDLQHKYDVLLVAFISLIRAWTGCSEEEATAKVAELCAITQTEVFDPVGRTIEKLQNQGADHA
jgi:hypothetical protein